MKNTPLYKPALVSNLLDSYLSTAVKSIFFAHFGMPQHCRRQFSINAAALLRSSGVVKLKLENSTIAQEND